MDKMFHKCNDKMDQVLGPWLATQSFWLWTGTALSVVATRGVNQGVGDYHFLLLL